MLSMKDRADVRRNAGKAAAILKMLSHKARLLVLCDLVGSERTAGELVESSGLSQSALSQHLAKLRQEHLVETRRDGQTIHYRLANGKTAKLIETLHNLYCGRK